MLMTLHRTEDPAPVSPPARTKVAIIGFADSLKEAPFADPNIEIWGLNEVWKYLPRWDRWFELHPRDVFAKEGDRDQAAHVAWLQQQEGDKPIYMIEPHADIPGSVGYPLDAMTAKFFPGQRRGYFTSSISFMLALAIAEGFEWIGLYGVDLASDVEYANQRAATEYLLGVARGMGRTVVIANGSALLKAPAIYGYDQDPDHANVPLSLGWLRKRAAELKEKREHTLSVLQTFDGALEEALYHVTLAEVRERGVQRIGR